MSFHSSLCGGHIPKMTYKTGQDVSPAFFFFCPVYLLTHHNHPTLSSLFYDPPWQNTFIPSFFLQAGFCCCCCFLLKTVLSSLFTRPTPTYPSGFSPEAFLELQSQQNLFCTHRTLCASLHSCLWT